MRTFPILLLAAVCAFSARAEPDEPAHGSKKHKKADRSKAAAKKKSEKPHKTKTKKASFLGEMDAMFAPKGTLKGVSDDVKAGTQSDTDSHAKIHDDSGVNLNRRKDGFKIGAHGNF